MPAAKVVTVVGNRPQFVKAAAVSRHLRDGGIDETLVHSGQHYDRELSSVFFEELGLPPPGHNLAIGSGTHAAQTAAAMVGLEPILVADPPRAVLVYGDTNTTLAAAVVAAKRGVPVVHVEAGMRSFDRSMPEEVNRVAVDRLSDLLLCSTETAMANLAGEGMGARAVLVGDVMADIALELGPIADRRSSKGSASPSTGSSWRPCTGPETSTIRRRCEARSTSCSRSPTGMAPSSGRCTPAPALGWSRRASWGGSKTTPRCGCAAPSATST